jgi:hypothetical protein
LTPPPQSAAFRSRIPGAEKHRRDRANSKYQSASLEAENCSFAFLCDIVRIRIAEIPLSDVRREVVTNNWIAGTDAQYSQEITA